MALDIETLAKHFEEAVASAEHPYHEPAVELLRAFEQMALGKGKDRHANDLPFIEQKMQRIADAQGTSAGLTYQIGKKSIEADSLPAERGIAERYGAIVYALGANLWIKRHVTGEIKPRQSANGSTPTPHLEREETPELTGDEQYQQDHADHDVAEWVSVAIGGEVYRCPNCNQLPVVDQYSGEYKPVFPYRIVHADDACPARYRLEHYDRSLKLCRANWNAHCRLLGRG